MSTPFALVDTNHVRDIAPEVLGDDGRLKVLPAEYWDTTTPAERALFGHKHGLYSFPTIELVDYLRELIGDRSAIEIGAGHGVLAEALGIPATDSKQQIQPKYRQMYRDMGQPIVPYGPNIIERDAIKAVRKFKPQVVIGCWVTHKYNPRRHSAGGNEAGVVEEDIIASCDTYVNIGNEFVHKGKSIWNKPHSIIYPDWLFSRSHNETRDFIGIWE